MAAAAAAAARYDNDYPVEDQSIVEFLEKPRLFLEEGAATVRVRITEASTWPKHGNKHFYFRVSTSGVVAGEKVTQCCTKAFQVLSKSIEHLKYELAQLGESSETTVDDVRNKCVRAPRVAWRRGHLHARGSVHVCVWCVWVGGGHSFGWMDVLRF